MLCSADGTLCLIVAATIVNSFAWTVNTILEFVRAVADQDDYSTHKKTP